MPIVSATLMITGPHDMEVAIFLGPKRMTQPVKYLAELKVVREKDGTSVASYQHSTGESVQEAIAGAAAHIQKIEDLTSFIVRIERRSTTSESS